MIVQPLLLPPSVESVAYQVVAGVAVDRLILIPLTLIVPPPVLVSVCDAAVTLPIVTA